MQVCDIQSIWLVCENKYIVHQISKIYLMLGLNMLPQCTVTIAAGGLLNKDNRVTRADDLYFLRAGMDCKLYIRINNVRVLLMSGILADPSTEFMSTIDTANAYRVYRILSSTEKIDTIPPMAVRYLTNAVAGSQQALASFLRVSDSTSAAKGKAYQDNKDSTDIGKVILDSINAMQNKITDTTDNEFAKYIKYDKIALQVKYLPTGFNTYIVDRLASMLLQGHSYWSAMQTLCNELLLQLVPRVYDNNMYMCITHLNPWVEPDKKDAVNLSTDQYCTIAQTMTAGRSLNIDGVIIPRYMDNTSPDISQYVVFGQYEDENGEVKIITSETLKNKDKTSSFKMLERSLPQWLVGDPTGGGGTNASADSENLDILTRMCKEFFAQNACQGNCIQVDVPLPIGLSAMSNIGKAYKLMIPDFADPSIAVEGLLDQFGKYIYAQLNAVTLHIQNSPQNLDIYSSMMFTAVHDEKLHKSLQFQDNKDLLYTAAPATATASPAIKLGKLYDDGDYLDY